MSGRHVFASRPLRVRPFLFFADLSAGLQPVLCGSSDSSSRAMLQRLPGELLERVFDGLPCSGAGDCARVRLALTCLACKAVFYDSGIRAVVRERSLDDKVWFEAPREPGDVDLTFWFDAQIRYGYDPEFPRVKQAYCCFKDCCYSEGGPLRLNNRSQNAGSWLLTCKNHLERGLCMAKHLPGCVAPRGNITWLCMGKTGPKCTLRLVSLGHMTSVPYENYSILTVLLLQTPQHTESLKSQAALLKSRESEAREYLTAVSHR